MRIRSVFQWIIMMALITVSTVTAQTDDSDDLRLSGAWVLPGETISVAYLRIHNDGETDDQLIAVHTRDGMAEVHENQMQNDVIRMRPVDAIDIPAGEIIVLEPGGYHIMLMNFDEPLVEGDSVRLALVFASGIEISIDAWISNTPIPYELEPDTLTDLSLTAILDDIYVGQVVNPPIQVQDFVAIGSDDDLNQLSDTDGTWRVIFFGYIHCPDFCPLTLLDYRDARALLGANSAEVTFMMISVDAGRDRPEIMRHYLDNFDPAFVGFSPDDATLSRIQPDYDFYYERRLDEGTQAIYTVDHSTRSYLLDRDGVLRASFAYNTHPRELAATLLWYMENE